MRRSLHRLILCTLVLLTTASAMLAARSFFTGDLIQLVRRVSIGPLSDCEYSYQYSSGTGGFSLCMGYTHYNYTSAEEAIEVRQRMGPRDGRYYLGWIDGGGWYGGSIYSPRLPHFLGFAFKDLAHLNGHVTVIALPWAVPIIAFGAYPIWRLWNAWRRRRRFAVGHCQTCGYDLRASPQRCPECGVSIVPAKSVIPSDWDSEVGLAPTAALSPERRPEH